MAKKTKTVRVLLIEPRDSGYKYTEYEMDAAVLKDAEKISECEPDIFGVFIRQLESKARMLLGI